MYKIDLFQYKSQFHYFFNVNPVFANLWYDRFIQPNFFVIINQRLIIYILKSFIQEQNWQLFEYGHCWSPCTH
jgi:hypothetical protein